MSKLVVHKKGYKRKGFTAHRGGKAYHVSPTQVPASTFKITDRGARGRGKKIVPPLKEGQLGGKGFFEKPKSAQKRIAFQDAKRRGEKKTVGSLRAIQVFNKRVNPKLSKKAKELSSEVAGSFKGKKRVPYPTGFRSKKRQMKQVS
jgi:hypothetical protein